ncbi:glycosyltransferase [Maridesulfovibrio zosterae]|uniref:glycosyltransferase n=1 Tax=Maridesulfovibrio zosterae TaxID=82171 RepID=UPI0003F8F023|nr:glycosyltransferase [Maridesulfovibrio zosterae]
MRILFVSESIWDLGPVFDLHMLAEGLSQLGHTVFAVDPGRDNIEFPNQDIRSKHSEQLRAFESGTVHLRSPRFDPRLGSMQGVRGALQLYQLHRWQRRYQQIETVLKEESIDVIVLYSGVRNGIQTVRLARKYGVPVVFRNVDMLYKLWPAGIKRRVAKLLEQYVYPRVDKLMALTPRYADYMVRLGASREKVELLLFPLELEQFKPRAVKVGFREKWGITDDDRVLVFIGTLYEFGGMKDFVSRFPEVLASVPQAKLFVVGDGVIRQEMERIIDDINLGDRVVMTGFQPFEDMPEFVNTATLCVNVFPINKNTEDIFSAKIVQYMACGKPTVSSALPGITTLIPGEGAGVLYAEDVTDLIGQLAELLQSPDQCSSLVADAQAFVQDNFDCYKVIRRLESVLEGIVNSVCKR